MRRFYWVSLLILSTTSFAHFTNLIVFGDSLSDGGNFPESQKIWWKTDNGKTLNNAVPQLYVPFSNPVDTRFDTYNVPWPPLNDQYLSKQTVISNTNTPRKYRSLSWPQFFLAFAQASKLTNNAFISPSNLLNTRAIPPHFSFNYAWGYAMSTENCVNPYYEPIKPCDANSIYTARKNYEENPTDENYKKIQIPGSYKQVELFIHDQRANKIAVDQNTKYVFWIGANDLIRATIIAENHWNPLPALGFIVGSAAENTLKSISLLEYALPKDKRPKTIYVFNLFNPELTPAFYHLKTMGALGNFAMHCHNFWLKVNTGIFNLFSNTKVVILPAYDWYANSSKNPYFAKQLGEDCQLNGGNFESPTVIPKTNCAGFMFWNSVHPAIAMDIMEAKQFLKVTTGR